VTPDPFVVVVAGVLGALIGSFLNVCITRLPRGESVVRPRSRCPRCGTPIAWYDNVPVVSWLVLRGRCRACAEPISAMYPLVELAVAALWAWMAWRHGPGLEAFSGAAFGTLLAGIALTDAREFIIPHEFSYGGLLLGLVLGFAGGLAAGLDAIHHAIFGAGLVYLIGAVAELAVKKAAMGGGDVAMMAMVGAFLGWQAVLATLFLGAIVGIVLHLGLRAATRGRRGEPAPPEVSMEDKTPEQLRAEGYLPFGVGLAVAAGLIAFLIGPERVIEWFASYAAAIGL
jgi:leader peptidase (prepilin peptidase)/N-methyltransferase